MTTSMQGLSNAELVVVQARARVIEAKKEAGRIVADAEGAFQEALRVRDLVLAGVSLDVVEAAERIICVTNPKNALVGEGRQAIRDAIEAFTQPTLKVAYENGNVRLDLHRTYVGTKNYAQWTGQREYHEHGRGPAHGHMIFRVELRPEYREKSRWEGGRWVTTPAEREITDADRDAVIAYLHHLLRDE